MEIIKNKLFIYFTFFCVMVLLGSCKKLCTNREIIVKNLHEEFKNSLPEYTFLNSEEMLSHFPIMECGKNYFWRARYLIPYGHIISNDGAYYLEKTPYINIDSILSLFSFKSQVRRESSISNPKFLFYMCII
ncbi:MAG: hypothetical protein LBC89_00140 [Bacteroidales bacterium]|jgi:hypothetical protein|nr:hypothetical protein [Bacteroidales bacterium]